MIKGIGTDIIEIERFKNWHSFSQKQLLKIFSPDEITYCLSIPQKTAERFAARFAAKEAFYKALSINYSHNLSLLQLCKYVQIIKDQEYPQLDVDWAGLSGKIHIPLKNPAVLISLSHNKSSAIAMVILQGE